MSSLVFARAVDRGMTVLGGTFNVDLAGTIVDADGYSRGFTVTRSTTGVFDVTLDEIPFKVLACVCSLKTNTTPRAFSFATIIPAPLASNSKTVRINAMLAANGALTDPTQSEGISFVLLIEKAPA